MPQTIVTYAGSTRTWNIILRDSQGAALAGLYTLADTLSAAVWAGEDQAPLLVPTVAWIDPAAPSVSLTITAAQLAAAGLSDDTYHVALTVTTVADGQPTLAWSGFLEVKDAPGSAAALSAYATTGDLMAVAPSVGELQSDRSDLAGFAAQRHEARVEFDARVLNRYRPQPGRSRRMLDVAGTAPGPYQRLAGSPDGLPPPTPAQVKTWLSTGRLLVTDEIKVANAYLAAALVYEDQITAGDQSATNTYAGLAKLYRDRFDQKWPECVVEFDSTGAVPAATATHRIDRDVTYLT